MPSTWWFSPLTPVGTATPSGFRPRQYPTLPGQNILWQPRAQDAISFETLRALAETWDLLRMVIKTKKAQLVAQPLEIRVKGKSGEKKADRKERSANDPTLQQLNAFFEYPDGIHPFKRWLNMWLEDMLVIDAVAFWLQRDTKGRVSAITPLAGDTINRMVTDQGITPRPDPRGVNCSPHCSQVARWTIGSAIPSPSTRRSFIHCSLRSSSWRGCPPPWPSTPPPTYPTGFDAAPQWGLAVQPQVIRCTGPNRKTERFSAFAQVSGVSPCPPAATNSTSTSWRFVAAYTAIEFAASRLVAVFLNPGPCGYFSVPQSNRSSGQPGCLNVVFMPTPR